MNELELTLLIAAGWLVIATAAGVLFGKALKRLNKPTPPRQEGEGE